MEAALFDWDGTLVDSLGPLYRANLAVMRSFGLPYDEATYRSTYQPDWRRMYDRLGIPADRLDEATPDRRTRSSPAPRRPSSASPGRGCGAAS